MEGREFLHYRILEKLGQGGMGEVHAAEDTRLSRKIALKILPKEMARQPERRSRFEREAKAIAALNHPNIVTIHSVEEDAGTNFITMELVEGRTLREVVPDTGLGVREIFELAVPMIDAISAAHEKGITHRDLKPDNVMVTREGRVKVLDFGLAKLFDPEDPTDPNSPGNTDTIESTETADNPLGPAITEEGKILGTVAYMSPEQAEGKPAGPRSDVFSFGVLLYSMATGRRPFHGDTSASTIASILRDTPPLVTDLKRELPDEFGRIVRRCMEKEPGRRFQSAADLRIELEELRSTYSSPGRAELQELVDQGFRGQVRRAGLPRLLVIYVAVSALVLFVVRFLMLELGLPGWAFPGAGLLLLIGLPVLSATAIVQSALTSLSGTSGQGDREERSKREAPLAWLTWRRAIGGGVLAFVVGALLTVGYIVARSSGVGPAASLVSSGILEERGKILVSEFENSTSEPELAGAMRQALSIDLTQSRAVRLVSAGEIQKILQRMERDARSSLDLELAREVAMRGGIPAVLAGTISPAGDGVVLSIRLVTAEDGAILAGFRETADGPDAVIGAIDRLSKRLRERIGESFKSIHQSPPLEQVTTGSLSALQKYSQAVVASDHKGDIDSAIALLEEATAADTTFAMAYRKLGIILGNRYEQPERRTDAFKRAFRHRNRLTERERYLTEAGYYGGVLRDRERTVLAYRRLLEIDPDDPWALNNLAILYQAMGRGELALEMLERAYEVESSPLHLGNIISTSYELGHVEDAIDFLDELGELFPDNPNHEFAWAGIEANRGNYTEALNHLETLRTNWPGSDKIGRDYRSWGHAIYATQGQLSRAHQLANEQMSELLEEGRLNGYWDEVTEHAAVREIYLNDGSGFAMVEEAAKRVPLESFGTLEHHYSELSMMYATAGRVEEARAFSEEANRLAETRQEGARQSSYYAGLGMIALQEGHFEEAFEQLHRWRVESRGDADALPWLGYAHRRAAQPDSAMYYLEKYVDQRSFYRHFIDQYDLPRSYQQLGELYEEAGDRKKAAHYYSLFVELLRDADPEIQPAVELMRQRISRVLAES